MPNDKGLILHQDAPGDRIFLVNDQPKSSTVVLSGSHFFSRFSQKLSLNSPKFLLFKKYLSPLSGKAGEFYFGFTKPGMVVCQINQRELYINFLSFFFQKELTGFKC